MGRRAGQPVRAPGSPRGGDRAPGRVGPRVSRTPRPGTRSGPGRPSTATAATAGEPRDEPGAAIRLRIPDEEATRVEDLLRGEITFPNEAQDDFVIARGDGTPLYNLAVAVDDAEMGITDVIRGDDHLSNTPKQVLVLAALGHRAAALRPPAAPARARRKEALEAPRRRIGPGASRPGLPPCGGAQLPGAARLGNRGRHDPDEHRGAPRALRRLAGRQGVGDLRRAEAALDQRAAHARAAARRVRRRRWPPTWAVPASAPGDPDRLRAACAIAQDKAQTLDEVWPLVRFLFEPPVDDPKARAKFLTDGGDAAPAGGAGAAGGGRAVRCRRRSSASCRRSSSAPG